MNSKEEGGTNRDHRKTTLFFPASVSRGTLFFSRSLQAETDRILRVSECLVIIASSWHTLRFQGDSWRGGFEKSFPRETRTSFPIRVITGALSSGFHLKSSGTPPSCPLTVFSGVPRCLLTVLFVFRGGHVTMENSFFPSSILASFHFSPAKMQSSFDVIEQLLAPFLKEHRNIVQVHANLLTKVDELKDRIEVLEAEKQRSTVGPLPPHAPAIPISDPYPMIGSGNPPGHFKG